MNSWLQAFGKAKSSVFRPDNVSANGDNSDNSPGRIPNVANVTIVSNSAEKQNRTVSFHDEMVESVQADFDERVAILIYDAQIPEEQARTEAFGLAIKNFSRIKLRQVQENELDIYAGLHHPAVKLATDVLGGRILSITKHDEVIWNSASPHLLKGKTI